jgi:hypothetical protein
MVTMATLDTLCAHVLSALDRDDREPFEVFADYFDAVNSTCWAEIGLAGHHVAAQVFGHDLADNGDMEALLSTLALAGWNAALHTLGLMTGSDPEELETVLEGWVENRVITPIPPPLTAEALHALFARLRRRAQEAAPC